MMEYDIQIFSLTKKFGNITAVDNLEIQVKKNTIFGLVGPDGAGKTTTMRMLCSLLVPDSGTAQIGSYNILKENEKIKQDIGYMPQRFSLYGDLTVLENLEFYSEVYQISKKERKEKIESLLEFSNLTKHSYKLADQLSGGMKQKLALSCNLIHTPKYLLLDEPTIGVDPVARREFWKILFELREQGTTIFVSTPYMDEAERCDEVGLMNKGRIVKKDIPSNIINNFDKHILCVYSDENHIARNLALEEKYVMDAYMLGEGLHIVVDDLDYASEKLREKFNNKIIVSSIKETAPSLEDVFVNIIKSEKR
ncbi:ABC transporter ATP-binding protein [Sedimentibacter hydroxybenzoicus DSM 7310]|uniref:ABC transporter ATP-binding protein n=1 Tax=Sedimentibacter hydroxybenzoicus DSM 7310 TaxID=1123245 RepID=A0A974BKG1_SEDHY|nr:ABC transporter ATP-binding protein [Sedimentibacter hydroxybenzoicus]NYB74668.1 ABC transporter ATP-binding protein [Sedimentibacter hydroxybenzoicus DSM 7310]